MNAFIQRASASPVTAEPLDLALLLLRLTKDHTELTIRQPQPDMLMISDAKTKRNLAIYDAKNGMHHLMPVSSNPDMVRLFNADRGHK